MDPLTHFAIGAAIGSVTVGRKVGIRRGALIGAAITMMPDADILIPSDGPLDRFIYHRGPTHSLFVQALAAPVIGEVLVRAGKRLRDSRLLAYGCAFAALFTHALTDGSTTYGTRLLWPLIDEPLTSSSLFIIDPIFSIPLLVALFVSLAMPGRVRLARRAATFAIAFGAAYIGWTLAAREIARDSVLDALAAAGRNHDRLMMVPMPFNSVLWRGLAVDGDSYVNVYVSLLDDGPAPLHVHPRNTALEAKLPDRAPVDKLDWFSDGYYAMSEAGGAIRMTDLRIGVEPDYLLTFEIARYNTEELTMIPPARPPSVRDWSQLGWVWRRIFDETAARDE